MTSKSNIEAERCLKVIHADVSSKSGSYSAKQSLALASSYFDVISSGVPVIKVELQIVCSFFLLFSLSSLTFGITWLLQLSMQSLHETSDFLPAIDLCSHRRSSLQFPPITMGLRSNYHDVTFAIL